MRSCFYTGKLKILSPMSIGSGGNEYTDHDVLIDEVGKPYIPGTTMAGVCRHYIKDNGFDDNLLFGNIKDKENEEVRESRIIFYDAILKGDFARSKRDGIKIDEYGVTAQTGKFDTEIIDVSKFKDSYFEFRIEIEDYLDEDKKAIDNIFNGINNGLIRFGYKTKRGFGKAKVEDAKCLEINNIKDLIEFKWPNVVNNYSYINEEIGEKITCKFKVRSFVLINNAIEEKDGDSTISGEGLKNVKNNPVIPGSSWAGVFRSHFIKILNCFEEYDYIKSFIEEVFGSTDKASKIIFDESEIIGSKDIVQTRNSIDRFTGGAAYKKLFSTRIPFGGTIELNITLLKGIKDEYLQLVKQLIDVTINDINDGYVNIGGLGSIGGGILEKV